MASASRFRRTCRRFLTACTLALVFGSAPAAALALCCACNPPTVKDSVCLTSGTATSCDQIITSSKNPLLTGYTCTSKALTNETCQTPTVLGKGVCKLGLVDAYSYIPSAANTKQYVARAPVLNVPIPGLTFSDFATLEGSAVNVPFLAQYIAGIYRYLVGISVIAAAIMIVYGGFRYIIGSTFDDIGKAKSIIRDAIIGLLLIFATYTILATTNQNTLNLQAVKVTYINPIAQGLEKVNADLPPNPNELGGNYAAALGKAPQSKPAPAAPADVAPPVPAPVPSQNPNAPQSPGGANGCNPTTKVTYFAQGGGTWGSKPLGNLRACTNATVPNSFSDALGRDQTERELYGSQGNAQCCMLYGDSACGPTSVAMVLASYGEAIDPGSAGDIGVAAGLRNCNTGGVSPVAIVNARFPDYTYDDSLDKRFSNPKANASAKKDMTGLDTVLKSGHPVIFLCSGCTVWKKDSLGKPKNQLVKRQDWYSFNGHFMVLTGVYDDGNYAVNDPSRAAFNLISRDEVESGRVGLIYIRRKDNKPITACSSQ